MVGDFASLEMIGLAWFFGKETLFSYESTNLGAPLICIQTCLGRQDGSTLPRITSLALQLQVRGFSCTFLSQHYTSRAVSA
jgi:hypothetical protein